MNNSNYNSVLHISETVYQSNNATNRYDCVDDDDGFEIFFPINKSQKAGTSHHSLAEKNAMQRKPQHVQQNNLKGKLTHCSVAKYLLGLKVTQSTKQKTVTALTELWSYVRTLDQDLGNGGLHGMANLHQLENGNEVIKKISL